MLKRFIFAAVAFVALIVPGTFGFALIAAPAAPVPFDPPGCGQDLLSAGDKLASWQIRLQQVPATDGEQMCKMTRLYFLEMVKARAVTALCNRTPTRAHELSRLDADVDTLNKSIASVCH